MRFPASVCVFRFEGLGALELGNNGKCVCTHARCVLGGERHLATASQSSHTKLNYESKVLQKLFATMRKVLRETVSR